jgi:hypothetical protein
MPLTEQRPADARLDSKIPTAILIFPVSLRSGFSSMKSQLPHENQLGNHLKRFK